MANAGTAADGATGSSDRARKIELDLRTMAKGQGMMAGDLRTRMGPAFSDIVSIRDADSTAAARERAVATVRQLALSLSSEDQLVIAAAFGFERRTLGMRHLDQRIDWLSSELGVSDRTIRRRINHAIRELALRASLESSNVRVADPRQEWFIQSVRAVVRLDTPAPEVREERIIVCAADGLSGLEASISLPALADVEDDQWPTFEVVFGARVAGSRRIGKSYFSFDLRFPQSLQMGGLHTYETLVRLPSHQHLRPHYAFTPLNPCESLDLRVRFDATHPPAEVWRLDGTPPRVLDEPWDGHQKLHPDSVGDVHVAFRHLRQGLGYGVGWTPWAG